MGGEMTGAHADAGAAVPGVIRRRLVIVPSAMMHGAGEPVVLRALMDPSPFSKANAKEQGHAEHYGDAGEETMQA